MLLYLHNCFSKILKVWCIEDCLYAFIQIRLPEIHLVQPIRPFKFGNLFINVSLILSRWTKKPFKYLICYSRCGVISQQQETILFLWQLHFLNSLIVFTRSRFLNYGFYLCTSLILIALCDGTSFFLQVSSLFQIESKEKAAGSNKYLTSGD